MRGTVGQALVTRLAAHGVDTVFGIPGVHTAELYRGLAASPIRHVTPRHEQSAGFMADGYARLSGRPGVCLLITGPGLTNAITAMAQARADSVPMLVISSVNPLAGRGQGQGCLHELPDQAALVRTVALWTRTLERGADLESVLAEAFVAMTSGRPGPVHIEIPLDVMAEEVELSGDPAPPALSAEVPPQAELAEAADRCRAARRPVLLLGGGSVGAEVQALAERLDAPVVTTVNARGMMASHRLLVPASPSLAPVRALLAEADLVIAVGTEFGQTDFDIYLDGGFPSLAQLIRIDIDRQSAGPVADQLILGDAATVLAALTALLEGPGKPADGTGRAARARDAALAALTDEYREAVALLHRIAAALPGCVMVGDSTHLVYAGNLYVEVAHRPGWFNSATGYGALGYGAPAAIGAQLAEPETPVVCLTGDGGLQFCLAELGTAMDERAPVIFAVWNNRGYREIEAYMRDRGIAPVGVRPSPPDFVAVAGAYGMAGEHITRLGDLEAALIRARESRAPYLIEIRVA